MKFLKALTQKKLAKAVAFGLLVSGGIFVGMGQAYAVTNAYLSGAKWDGSACFGSGAWIAINTEQEIKVTSEGPGEEYSDGDIVGTYTESSSNASNGKVIVEGGKILNSVYGGYSDYKSTTGNKVTVNSGVFSQEVTGGFSGFAEANGNIATVTGGAISGNVYGGVGDSSACNNIVNISGGKLYSKVYGGFAYYKSKANGNLVTITGGDIDGNVHGGFCYGGSTNDNKINLVGQGGKLDVVTGSNGDEPVTVENNKKISITGIVYGGSVTTGYKSGGIGNTLNVAGKNISVGGVANFQKLNFYIQNGLTYGDTMVNITGSESTDISGAKVNVIVEAKPQANKEDANLKNINLLSNTNGITWKDNPTKGAELDKEDYNIILLDGVKLQLVEDKNIVALNDEKNALVLTLVEPEPEPEPKPEPKPELPTIATSAATPLFEAIKDNKANLSENLQGFVDNLIANIDGSNIEASAANIKAAISGAYQASEITGTTSTAVSVTNNVSNLTFTRLSLVEPGAGVSGGKGVGLMAPDSGADVWARYVHGKDKADGMKMDGGSAEYSNNYNGVLVGADFKKVGKFQSGIAFSYVDGSGSNSFKDTMGATARYGHTDFHTYNFGYYGSIKNDDTNTMFDLSYGTTSADSDTHGVGGEQSFSAKSKIFNAGVTAEKSFDVSGMKLVPYTGLRYMHVDGGEYTDSLGIHHRADKQNVFMLPVGLKLSKENKLSHDWTLTPKLDLSYTWNMGDTDSEMTVSVPGLTASNLSYSVMDKGSFMGVAGIEAQRKNWTYGVSYAYQKGSHQDSKKIIADIKMSF